MARVVVQDALDDGGMEEVRSAIHCASRKHGGSLPLQEPWVAHARKQLSQAEKCERECRDGLRNHDMLLVQEAVDKARTIKLGPRLWHKNHLETSKTHVDQWRKYKPYLQKLHDFHHHLQDIGKKGLKHYCQYWAEVVDGHQLNQEYEEAATAQLASHEGARQALEEVLNADDCRLLYHVPWSERHRLRTSVRFQLSRLGFDVHVLHFYAAPGPDDLTAIVVTGKDEAVQEVLAATAGTTEPIALGEEAHRETNEEKELRVQRLLEKLDVAVSKLHSASNTYSEEGVAGITGFGTAKDRYERRRSAAVGVSGMTPSMKKRRSLAAPAFIAGGAASFASTPSHAAAEPRARHGSISSVTEAREVGSRSRKGTARSLHFEADADGLPTSPKMADLDVTREPGGSPWTTLVENESLPEEQPRIEKRFSDTRTLLTDLYRAASPVVSPEDQVMASQDELPTTMSPEQRDSGAAGASGNKDEEDELPNATSAAPKQPDGGGAGGGGNDDEDDEFMATWNADLPQASQTETESSHKAEAKLPNTTSASLEQPPDGGAGGVGNDEDDEFMATWNADLPQASQTETASSHKAEVATEFKDLVENSQDDMPAFDSVMDAKGGSQKATGESDDDFMAAWNA